MHDQPIPRGFCQCGCGAKTPPYKQSDTKTGAIKGEPSRYLHGHRRAQFPYEERDCGHDTPCWVWLAAMDKNGYGRAGGSRADGSRTGSTLAHRRLYERLVGPVPGGLPLDHLCRNRACVNPDHLEPVTLRENAMRGKLARLTEDDVAAMRASAESALELARSYGVSESQVYRVLRYEQWKDVPARPKAQSGQSGATPCRGSSHRTPAPAIPNPTRKAA